MTISYKVKYQKTQEAGIIVNLSSIHYLNIPAHLAVAVGSPQSKIDRLASYYAKGYTSEDKKFDGLRHVMASIRNEAVKLGVLTVLSDSKVRDVHTKAFVKFMVDNDETIKITSPYILNTSTGATSVDTGTDDEVKHTPNISTGNPELDAIQLNGKGIERLSADDMTQIKTLLMREGVMGQVNNNPEVILTGEDEVVDAVVEDVEFREVVENQEQEPVQQVQQEQPEEQQETSEEEKKEEPKAEE